jgi:HTH-type transcriptional regulator/antitoxin HipB
MVIRTPADLAAAIRAGRRALGLDQAGLAARVGVQRQWVVKIESGKSTAEVGLVLCTLNALGLKTEIGESLDEPAAMDPPGRPLV